MSAPERQPRDGVDAAVVCLWHRLSPRVRRAFHDALVRRVDGQPFEEAIVEMLVELGDTPAAARRKVRETLDAPGNWRELLN